MQKGLRSLQSQPHHYVRRAGTGAPSLPEAQMSRGNGERGRLLKQAENSALRPPERLRPSGRMTALPDRLSSTRDVWMGKLRPREKRVGRGPPPWTLPVLGFTQRDATNSCFSTFRSSSCWFSSRNLRGWVFWKHADPCGSWETSWSCVPPSPARPPSACAASSHLAL